MNKAELVALVSEKVDLTKKSTEEVINILFDNNENLEPLTYNGEDIDIPQQRTPAFKSGKVLKNMVR